jgi:hypothetical protein
VCGQPQSGSLRFLFTARAEWALLVIIGMFYRHGFGVSQQDQFVHGGTPVGVVATAVLQVQGFSSAGV